MQFKADPLSVFARDSSPLAIHARLRWMNGGRAERALADRTAAGICRGQSPDGSWGGSIAATIQGLFDLWLLSADTGRPAAKAIDWLLEAPHPTLRGVCGGVYDGMFFRVGRADRAALRKLRSLPFTGGCSGFVKTGAALFFATVFNQGDARRVQAAYERAERVGQDRLGRWCSGPCGNNILQAVAAHPEHRRGRAMEMAVQALGERQDPRGVWGERVPFFQTLLALSQIRTDRAREQVRRALERAVDTQNKDGSWGRTQRAFNAFAVLTAMERVQC